MPARAISEIFLVNGSAGDPVLFIDYPGKHNALLFDAGDNCRLDTKRLSDLEAIFVTHHHVDHFVGLDRIIRANLGEKKTLHLYGPPDTIEKVYSRLKGYDYPDFSFQQCRVKVHDVWPGKLRWAELHCRNPCPPPAVQERRWKGPVLYENKELRVETVPVDHTVPCLAYALVEKRGYHPDPAKLQEGVLKAGRWIGAVLDRLRAGESLKSTIEIAGGTYTLGALAEQYFTTTPGGRIAFVTDTAWSEQSRPGLTKLAHRAHRLYCDSFYAKGQERQAEKYRHMTATAAAELAREAKVEELILMHFAPRYAGKYDMLIEEARTVFPKVRAEW
ncbi:MAG: ribonuclease Z [Gemmatales bacterium]|nr:MAG: ribonuclease Z [Gemmatales bacterium]